MNVQELIQNVQGLGGELALHGERIHYRLPHTPDAPRLVEEMRAHREEIIAALRERDKGARAPDLTVPGRGTCDSPNCAGCYDVGDGQRIHPPKCGEGYRAWLERWQAKGRVQ